MSQRLTPVLAILTRVLNSSNCVRMHNAPTTSGYISQECGLDVLVVFGAMQDADHDFEEPCQLHCHMKSNNDPLTGPLDCYLTGQTFLPDSTDRLKSACVSPVSCRTICKNWAYQEVM
jgi:hypothetical protein